MASLDLTIIDNYGWKGAGIYLESSNPRLVNVLVAENHAAVNLCASGRGGGILFNSSSPTLLNVVISNNTRSVYCDDTFNIPYEEVNLIEKNESRKIKLHTSVNTSYC